MPHTSNLKSGVRLGPYEVISAIGAGGMGEVWRAKDTRLERDVAVKVLPASFAADAQLRIRFEREARTISSLNHPNICTLFDVGKEHDLDYLVMELIDGESLADRLRKGPLPIEDVLRIGNQIAAALQAAHRRGITHRDLKPGNVMLTRSGAKLLDFGLAKSASVDASLVPSTPDLTEAKPLTAEGTIIGTFQYMAPEQLEGLEADARTDIFALGCVLYEMATGKRAFEGRSRTSLIAAIVASQPAPIASLAPATPAALDHVVRRCLEKDPENRWQSAQDVAAELLWIANASSLDAIAPLPGKRRTKPFLPWAIAAVATVVGVTATVVSIVQRPVRPGMARVSLAPSGGRAFDFRAEGTGSIALSPDGTRAIFGIRESGTDDFLWVRVLATGEWKKISGSQGARNPFWSPDGRHLGFFAQGKLMKSDLSGAPPVALCDAEFGRGGSWSRDGTIVFSPTAVSGIFRISAAGGEPQPVTTLDSELDVSHRWPSFLPDGRRFVYFAATRAGLSSTPGTIWLASLDSAERKPLVSTFANAVVASGHLLFVRDDALMAQPLDEAAGRLVGEAVLLADSVLVDEGRGRAAFSASSTGAIAYRAGEAASLRTVTIFNREGTVLQRFEEPAVYASYSALTFSPDGSRLAIEIADTKERNDDLWILETDRAIRTRITFDPNGDFVPAWSNTGSRMAFSRAETAKHWYLIVRDVDGAGGEKVVYQSEEESIWATGWSPDDALLACSIQDGRGGRDVIVVPLDGSPPRRFLSAPYNEYNPTFSPDGKWIVYASNESGRPELYVISWPEGTNKRQISTGGLKAPMAGHWSGDRILFNSAQGVITSVRVRPNGASLDVEDPVSLFEVRDAVALGYARDGSRIAAAFPYVDESTPKADLVELILDWDAGGEDD